MPDVFINYRTGDGDKCATTIERELSRRFGEERIFYASKSIGAGESFDRELVRNVRRSSLLLAVIGPTWVHRPQLHDEQDWVRREILEAFACGITVIPVLDGRDVERLREADLPAALSQLANRQSIRVDLRHNARADLARVGDELATLVPSLEAADRDAQQPPSEPGSTSNSTGEVNGPVVQARDFTGDVGTVVKGSQGVVHTGTGDIRHEPRHFSGDVGTYFEGGNQGGVHNRFGTSRRREDGDR
ncbi:toll/interleukin-1 receptor domain-containing protein [Streptomyces sp. NPDC055025]